MQISCCQRLQIIVLLAHNSSFKLHPKTLAAALGCLSRAGVGITTFCGVALLFTGKGGKNRRRGKNESEEKRELIFKEDGQGTWRRSWPVLKLPASATVSGASSAGGKHCLWGGVGGIEALQTLRIFF